MEAVPSHALLGEPPRQREGLGDRRLGAVERGVEAGDLRQARGDRRHGPDGPQVVGLVQGASGTKASSADSTPRSTSTGRVNFRPPCTTRWPAAAMRRPPSLPRPQDNRNSIAPPCPSRPSAGHAFSPTVSPAASRAVKRGSVNSPSTWPRKSGSGGSPARKTVNLRLEEPAFRTRMASSMASPRGRLAGHGRQRAGSTGCNITRYRTTGPRSRPKDCGSARKRGPLNVCAWATLGREASIPLRHEIPPLQRLLVVVLSFARPLRELHLLPRRLLIGDGARRCAMQLRRAALLSSERTTCHGACLVSVAPSIRSRARE